MPDQPTSEQVVKGTDSNPQIGAEENLTQVKREATLLAEAYRLRLVGRLWWANLAFVVLPAVFATAAAIFAASSSSGGEVATTLAAMAAILAGLAAVLSAIHKALKCDEYQAECARLGPAYKAIAILADSAQASLDLAESKNVAKQFAELARSNRAPLPDEYLAKAIERIDNNLKPRPATKANNS